MSARLPTAVVMNLFYTGLGIARSLGERGVPVVGLSASRTAYGNYSRYLSSVRCADSQKDPDKLLPQVLELGRSLGPGSVLFPTRDADLVFLDRHRDALEPWFRLVVPPRDALARCLDKWETYRHAVLAGVPSPKSWLVEDLDDVRRAQLEVSYPCVLKPLEAHHWRTGSNWDLVGGRKAIVVNSHDELLAEYVAVSRANPRALLQERIGGDDRCLFVAACYVDREGTVRAAFNAQKLVQVPVGFGTGCIVQLVDRPELVDRTKVLLTRIGFRGIAEVEYKWDEAAGDYKLIEVNPRPWDQHRLGTASGVDLMYRAYCDHAGLPRPATSTAVGPWKWIAEDTFVLTVCRLAWRREGGLRELFSQARGRKVYGVWSTRDPLPSLAFAATLAGNLAVLAVRMLGRVPRRLLHARPKAALEVTR